MFFNILATFAEFEADLIRLRTREGVALLKPGRASTIAESDAAALAPTPNGISDARRSNMRAVKAKDTKPEFTVRRMLHRNGYRFRLHASALPGRPDIVFPARCKAIEVRGCFWHRHPDPACRNAVLPRTRREWWDAKLTMNVARDARNLTALEALGWTVLVLWECEVASPDLAGRLANFLGPAALAMRRPSAPDMAAGCVE